MKRLAAIISLIAGLFLGNHLQAQSIKKFSESASNFTKSPELSSNEYPITDMYRSYDKGGTGFKQVEGLKSKLEKKIREFAKKQDKDFVILGQSLQNGGMGRFPKVEIIFALTPKK